MRSRRQAPTLLLIALFIAPASFAAQNAPADAIRRLLADSSSIGLPAGAPAPHFVLNDQNSRNRDFASLTGPHGLVLVFFRSADW